MGTFFTPSVAVDCQIAYDFLTGDLADDNTADEEEKVGIVDGRPILLYLGGAETAYIKKLLHSWCQTYLTSSMSICTVPNSLALCI